MPPSIPESRRGAFRGSVGGSKHPWVVCKTFVFWSARPQIFVSRHGPKNHVVVQMPIVRPLHGSRKSVHAVDGWSPRRSFVSLLKGLGRTACGSCGKCVEQRYPAFAEDREHNAQHNSVVGHAKKHTVKHMSSPRRLRCQGQRLLDGRLDDSKPHGGWRR